MSIQTAYHYGPHHPGSGPSSLLKLAPCRWLAQCCPLTSPRPQLSPPGVLLLPAVLARNASTSNSYPCPECCLADPFSDHQVGCGRNGDRIACHNAMRDDVIFSAAQSAALAPTSACRSTGTDFVPLVAEMLGGLLRTPPSLLSAVQQAIGLVSLTLAPSRSNYSGDWT